MCVEKAKLIMSLIYREGFDISGLLEKIQKLYSPYDYSTNEMNFEYTDYYYSEMGYPLKRMIISFTELIDSSSLPDIKKKTCQIEDDYREEGMRPLNLDPGYITHAKLVLASTKNFFHRIHLRDGIFGEVTMAWARNDYRLFDWTYPDYASDEYRSHLIRIRKIFADQIKAV